MSLPHPPYGPALRAFVAAIRAEYENRAAYDVVARDLRQPNSLRVVACQVFEGLSADGQLAVIGDLYNLRTVGLVRRDPHDVFEASDSVASHIFDLACEVAWQILVEDPSLRIEDEIRLALTEAA